MRIALLSKALVVGAYQRKCEHMAEHAGVELSVLVPERWGRWIFSDEVATRLLPPVHGDSSGVRGAAWLWPAT